MRDEVVWTGGLKVCKSADSLTISIRLFSTPPTSSVAFRLEPSIIAMTIRNKEDEGLVCAEDNVIGNVLLLV